MLLKMIEMNLNASMRNNNRCNECQQQGGKTMKKKNKSLVAVLASIAVIAVIIIAVTLILDKDKVPKSENGFQLETVENSFDTYSEIYEEKYQNAIHEQIEARKTALKYDVENPLLIGNPYNTVTNGLYVYFETKRNQQVQYTIACDGYEDFTQTVYANSEDNLSKEHEFLMIGLIPGETNTITMNLLNASNEVQDTVTFTYDCPKAVGEFNVNQIEVEKGDSVQELSNGLYVILGNDIEFDIEDEDIKAAYVSMYDNNGTLRCEIPCVSYRAHRLLFDENGMYFSVSGGRIVRMDATGYVNRVYKLGSLLLHHDYVFGTNNDLVVLGSDNSMGTKEDIILSIDLDSKEVKTLIDLKEIFPDYYAMTTKPENSEYIDWMHINSLSFVDEDSVIFSSRETSTIIKLDDIYGEQTIGYMIGSDHFWEGTGYEDYLLSQEGEFSLQAGQHTITYQADDSLPEGQYYIYLYNNNNTISNTRPDYDWAADENYSNTGVSINANGASSYYYKYLVDENARTFSLIDTIEVAYSGYVSSVQEYGNNVIIDSGSELTTWEFDSEGNLIQQMQIVGNYWVYRTYKYDFKGYWFQ